jgi:hypothetical protein
MALPARTDALDVIVELLTELDQEPGSGGPGFYDRLCAALCRVTDMERASLLLYDEARQLVVPVGSHGIESGILEDIYGTLEETPIAQVALSEDRVVEVHGELERWVPERYARIGGVDTITCTPVSAGGRWLGVVFADRGGGHFTLADARACSRRASTSRARSTSASCSASSGCRSCWAPRGRSARRCGAAARRRCRPP